MNPEIGGYFELELPRHDNRLHSAGIYVNSGRNALEYILRHIGVDNIGTLYVPYYTCEVVLTPIRRLGVSFSFYHVDENLEIAYLPALNDNDYLIANNYYGIKDRYIDTLRRQLGRHLIVDNAQALFYPTDADAYAFYSPRKFVGVPDGGIAYVPGDTVRHDIGRSQSWDRCQQLLMRTDLGANDGFGAYQGNEDRLGDQPLSGMSALTRRILTSIDLETVIQTRRQNYSYLRDALQGTNLLDTPPVDDVACPMVYPYRTPDAGLRSRLISNRVYVATYWPNVRQWCAPATAEHDLAAQVIPLPIDQRYDITAMNRIISLITSPI